MTPQRLPAWLSRIEDAGLNASAPPQQRWVDGWLVRLSPGKAQRARCINALADGALPLGERLSICQALYREAGLRMLLRITPFSRPELLDSWLGELGFQRFGDSQVMVCNNIQSLPHSPVPPQALIFEEVDSKAYAHIVGELRGTELPQRLVHAQRLLHSPVPYCAAVLRDTAGQVLACAQTAVESQMVGLYDVHTADMARGRGLSSWLCARMLVDARRRGAKRGYLQVDAHNAPARAVYLRLGFSDAYGYHYRALPVAA